MHTRCTRTTPSRGTPKPLSGAWALAAIAALGVLDGPARASDVASSAAASLPQGSKAMTILVGRSEHMTLPWPAKGASVTDPAVADINLLTPSILLVTGKAVGTTNVLVWSEDGRTIEASVQVAPDLSRLAGEISAMFPNSGVTIRQTQDTVVLSGVLDRAEQADALRRYLDAQGVQFVDTTTVAGVQQVQVQVRMAEVSRTAIRALGVNGNIMGSDAYAISNIGSLTSTSNALASPPVGFNTTVSPEVNLIAGLTNGDLQLFIRALAENRYLRVLAEPNLVALSGSEASFLAGGEVPIPISQGGTGGGAAISIQFKPFGISLRFRPTVLGDNGIRLEIASEVSEIDPSIGTSIGGITTPGFTTRRAETTLEMSSGQTFAMAGLLSEKVTGTASRYPVLGDLPILGALFRSTSYQKGETELLLLVTANLVEPVSDLSLPPMPGQATPDPTDWELYIDGRLEGRVPARLSADDAEWMKSMGLERLKGPGAWMSYGQPPAASTARSAQGGTGDRPTAGGQ